MKQGGVKNLEIGRWGATLTGPGRIETTGFGCGAFNMIRIRPFSPIDLSTQLGSSFNVDDLMKFP